MNRLSYAIALSLALSGCATVSTSPLVTAEQSFAETQQVFKSVQQAAIAAIQTGALTGEAKAKAISALETGALAENAGFAAEQTASAPNLNVALISLAASVAQLQVLLAPKGN